MATVARDLAVAYHLGVNGDSYNSFVTPATAESEPRVVAMWPQTTCWPVPETKGTVTGAVPVITVSTPAAVNTGLLQVPHSDVYYRIWVVPPTITQQNPAFNVDVPFRVWSAYLVSNTLNSITPVGATGLTLDLSAPRVFAPVEEVLVNLQVTSAAPAVVDATYTFTFDLGSGTFDYEAVLIEWIREIAEIPVTETWTWYTDVMRARNSTEQRVSVRRQPRRLMQFPMVVADDSEYRTWYDRLYNYMATQVLIPFHQYHTLITAGSAVSATSISFDLAQTDVRAGEYVVILRPTDGATFVIKLGTLTGSGANTDAPLTQATQVGDLLFPAAFGRLVDKSSIEMGSIAGTVDVGAYIIDFRTQFNRPGSAAVITSFDSLNVLTELPVVTRNKARTTFEAGVTVIDNETGVHVSSSQWTHAYEGGGRQFYIARRLDPGKMDYWRDFLVAARGQQVPFLMPSWRADLTLAATPLPGAAQILVNRSNYATNYFPYDTYTRFQFKATDGSLIYRKATGAAAQAGNQSLITLDTPLPVTAIWGLGFTISFLNRARLADDAVRWTHFGAFSLLDLVMRTTDQ